MSAGQASAEESRAGRAFWQGPLDAVAALLPQGTDTARFRQMPANYRRSYVRALQGKASPKHRQAHVNAGWRDVFEHCPQREFWLGLIPLYGAGVVASRRFC